ncbi:synaptic vesicle glycoprotein 2B-like isoform X2 [Hermetia illucens]|nr:synaptic vesicle glycoprotein 2B-like isoform X2 [Hermetia illucens]
MITVAGMILGAVIFETLGISFILPVTDCDLHFSTQEKGVLGAIGFIGIITSSHLWGFLADTKGRRRIILPTLIIAFTFTLISSFLNNFWSLVIFRYLNGFFVSGGSATVYAYLGEFHTNQARSKAIMGAAVIFAIAVLLIPGCAWLVINQSFQIYIPFLDIVYKPWRLFLLVCGIPSLICALCLFVIPESPKYTLLYKGQAETIQILSRIYSINTGNARETYPFTHIEQTDEYTLRVSDSALMRHPALNTFIAMWKQTSSLFHRKYLKQTVLGCLLQFITFITANGLYMWFPAIIDEIGEFRNLNPNGRASLCQILVGNKIHNHTNLEHAVPRCRETLDITTYQYALFLEALYVISLALIGFIVNAVGKISILFVILVGSGIAGLVVAYVTMPLLAIYLFIILMLSGLAPVVINAATVDLFPTSLRATAVCITLMFGRSGSVVGANIISSVLDVNCEAAFLFSGISLIFGGFMGLLIPKKLETDEKTEQRPKENYLSANSIHNI